MYGGLDGAIHLAEEAANAREAVPRALLSTWSLGFLTSFVISVAAMYSAQDFTTIASTPTGYVQSALWTRILLLIVDKDSLFSNCGVKPCDQRLQQTHLWPSSSSER